MASSASVDELDPIRVSPSISLPHFRGFTRGRRRKRLPISFPPNLSGPLPSFATEGYGSMRRGSFGALRGYASSSL